jgi:hypothetical protein
MRNLGDEDEWFAMDALLATKFCAVYIYTCTIMAWVDEEKEGTMGGMTGVDMCEEGATLCLPF